MFRTRSLPHISEPRTNNNKLTASIQQGRTVEEFPSVNGWKCDADLGVNAANRLTMICLNLPNIKYYAQDLLSRDKTSSTVIDMMTLIRTAKDIDSELEHWANTLPDFWNPSTKTIFTGEMPDDKEFLKKAEFWPGPIHVYGDLSIANVWNDYRVSRIFCQAVILGCVAALPAHARTDQIERISQQAVHITQEMVNDFSSALPYLLGYDIRSRKDGVADTGKFPCLHLPIHNREPERFTNTIFQPQKPPAHTLLSGPSL